MASSERRRIRGRPGRRQAARPSPLADKPFRLLRNPLAPVEVLSEEQLERIHLASMRILEDIGLDFWDEEALQIWEQAGARVDHDGRHVWLDRDLVLEAVARAPSRFTLHARNPAHNLQIGGDYIAFATVASAPFYSDLEVGRREGCLEDYRRIAKLAQLCGPIHLIEGQLVEPQDVPVPVRNLEKGFALFTLTDKALSTASHGRVVAADYISQAALVFGGLEALQQRPALTCVVNVNSPLRYDTSMLGALITYARHGQPPIVTPFILAGAMSPITLASALAQLNAEALAGIALTQLVNPGVPVVYGGFTTNTDMQSGSPAFGSPEGALALMAGAQLARRYGLPYRGSGGLNNAKLPDAQAAYETQMSLWPAVMAHTNVVIHSAGWLETGLVCSLEKFILDVEGLAMMHHLLAGLEVNDETLALDSIAEVGPGGHHFATEHTMAHFRDAFYLPLVSDRQNYNRWLERGAEDAPRRANRLARELLASYVPPALDPGIEEALQEHLERRKRELS
jgi:trimethylamine--corrinoid protein Co-methyltransferase